jgi:hypothetical protein
MLYGTNEVFKCAAEDDKGFGKQKKSHDFNQAIVSLFIQRSLVFRFFRDRRGHSY